MLSAFYIQMHSSLFIKDSYTKARIGQHLDLKEHADQGPFFAI